MPDPKPPPKVFPSSLLARTSAPSPAPPPVPLPKPPPKAFISHSKQDAALTKNVELMLQNIGVEPVIMEYSPPAAEAAPPWRRIRDAVTTSDAVLLFKTENAIVTDYTRSWIVYEVGLAAAMNRPLYVFERKGTPIHFPIPYVTDYMLFEQEKIGDFLKVRRVVKEWREGKVPDVAKPSILTTIPATTPTPAESTPPAPTPQGPVGWLAALIVGLALAAVFGEAEALGVWFGLPVLRRHP